MCLLTREEAFRFYSVHQQQPFFPRLLDFMTNGRVVAMELLAEGTVVVKVFACVVCVRMSICIGGKGEEEGVTLNSAHH